MEVAGPPVRPWVPPTTGRLRRQRSVVTRVRGTEGRRGRQTALWDTTWWTRVVVRQSEPRGSNTERDPDGNCGPRGDDVIDAARSGTLTAAVAGRGVTWAPGTPRSLPRFPGNLRRPETLRSGCSEAWNCGQAPQPPRLPAPSARALATPVPSSGPTRGPRPAAGRPPP